jgi:hypothetical protein
MTPDDIGNALLGLQGSHAAHEEVRAVLAALTVHLQRSRQKFTPRDISFSLMGLVQMQNKMQLQIPEVADILSELNIKVATSSLKGLPELKFTVKTKDDGHTGVRVEAAR